MKGSKSAHSDAQPCAAVRSPRRVASTQPLEAFTVMRPRALACARRKIRCGAFESYRAHFSRECMSAHISAQE